MIREAIDATGGRRFVLSLGAAVMTTALQWFGKLDPSGSTYALVIVGNTTQKVNAPGDK